MSWKILFWLCKTFIRSPEKYLALTVFWLKGHTLDGLVMVQRTVKLSFQKISELIAVRDGLVGQD